MKNWIGHRLLFPALLPVFFVMHAYVQHLGLVRPLTALILAVAYIFVSLLTFLVVKMVTRNKTGAAFASLLLLLLFFFFGALQDLLQHYFRFPYSLALSLVFVYTVIVLRAGKKYREDRSGFFVFFNLLFLILIFVEVITWMVKEKQLNKTALLTDRIRFNNSPLKERPDIYLLLLDEYAGKESLEQQLHFDNRLFREALAARGFQLIDSSFSNYNSTPFSIASLLNMGYLAGLKGSHKELADLVICYQALERSRLVNFLRENGYLFFNYSPFSIDGEKGITAHEGFIPQDGEFVTAETLAGRLHRDLGYHLLKMFNKVGETNRGELDYNNKVLDELEKNLKERGKSPRFIYAHLMMPHYPYYFNSEGKAYNLDSVHYEFNNQYRYLEYLRYTNDKVLGLLDRIQNNSLIVLMSDHGFRQWDKVPDSSALYNNLKALKWRDSSIATAAARNNANVFRLLLNNYFSQQLPLLKDTSFVIRGNQSE